MEYKYTYTGNLEFYSEQGMGSLAAILHDDRGLTKSPGFNNDTKKWDGPLENFKSIGWAVFIKGGEYLKVFDNNKVIWEGELSKSRSRFNGLSNNISFVPKEIELATWVGWFNSELRAEIQTNYPVISEGESNAKGI